MAQEFKNTEVEFYDHWSKEEMQNELVRLNVILEECKKILNTLPEQI